VRRWYVAAILITFHGLLLFVALNLVAWAILSAFPADPVTLTYGSRPYALVYPGRSLPEIRQLLRETWTRPVAWEPFTESRERRFSGRFVNVHRAGFRISSGQGPWPVDPSRANVFVFGGSTTFGYGVADDETVVSALQRFLDERLGSGRVACYNFGRGAYYSTGERILFQELLTTGDVPRVAVFIDGLNEFALAGPFPGSTLHMAVNFPVRGALTALADQLPATRLIARWKNVRHPRAPDAQVAEVYDDPALLDGRIERYLANRRIIASSAAAWGVRTLFVWQPVPTYKYDLRYHLTGDLDFGPNNYARFGYARMAARLLRDPGAPDLLWAADLQEGARAPLYVDQVHYTAATCALLAGEVGRALLARGILR
jgi:hypothetical protein